MLSLHKNCDHLQRLQQMVIKAMEENTIEFVVLTVLHNWREHIITKKKMKKYYEGKIEVDRGLRIDQNRYQESTLDDMESFIANILIGNVKEEDKYTFFLPKLSEAEVQMIEDQDIEFLNSFACYIKNLENPDVKYEEPLSLEMQEQQSKTKFLRGGSRRKTIFLKVPLHKNQNFWKICCKSIFSKFSK